MKMDGLIHVLRPGSSWPDYPDVIRGLRDAVDKIDPAVVIFYVCGSDHARKCGLNHRFSGFGMANVGLVMVSRAGDVVAVPASGRLVFSAVAPDEPTQNFSSSAVQRLLGELAAKEREVVAMLGEPVMAFIREQGLYGFPTPALPEPEASGRPTVVLVHISDTHNFISERTDLSSLPAGVSVLVVRSYLLVHNRIHSLVD